LFTENAPIDAIIQRAGRVNRKRGKPDTKVVVFEHSEITEKYVYTIKDILSNTFSILKNNQKRLTESDLLKMVDNVYESYDVETFEQNGERPFEKGLRRYDLIQKDYNYILDVVSQEEIFTRLGLDTVSVIPDCFQEKLIDETIMEKSKHEVSISKRRFDSLKCVKDENHEWFKYVDVIYDFETGLKFKDSKNTNNSSTSKCY
jgi:CRISPR-associated endonuclease/helicase Cas3